MWVKSLLERVPKPYVDNHQRLACARDIWRTLACSFDTARNYERVAYRYSGGNFSLYMSFVARLARRRMALGDFEAFCVSGDMTHRGLRNDRHDEVIRQLRVTKFDCSGIVTSTVRCVNRRCRGYNLGLVAKQTRSADEGMTGKYVCYDCGQKFSAG